MANKRNIQFASGLFDCGCSSIALVDEETFKKRRHHFGKMVRWCERCDGLRNPLW